MTKKKFIAYVKLDLNKHMTDDLRAYLSESPEDLSKIALDGFKSLTEQGQVINKVVADAFVIAILNNTRGYKDSVKDKVEKVLQPR